MELIIALFIGLLYACGVYLVLRRIIIKVILGIFVLSNATNLIIFLAGGVKRNGRGFIPEGSETIDPELISDPLPQALMITAIVIGVALTAATLTLYLSLHHQSGTTDWVKARLLQVNENLPSPSPVTRQDTDQAGAQSDA